MVHADGRAAGGALVWVESGTAPTPEIGIRADWQGGFRVALPAGRFTLCATAPDGSAGAATHCLDGEPGEPLVITLGERRD